MNKVKENLKDFFILWGVIVFLNQVILFGGCFAPYCLIAAIPHTFIISIFIAYLFFDDKSASSSKDKKDDSAEAFDWSQFLQDFSTNDHKDGKETATRSSANFRSKNKKTNDAKISSWEKQEVENELMRDTERLKSRGDGYELFIGRKFEEKGDLVIYNGLLKGYKDQGVDLVVISRRTETLHLIQCKNWQKYSFTMNHLKTIYSNLSDYHADYFDIDYDAINHYLSIKKSGSEIPLFLLMSKGYQIRKSLYLSSEDVIEDNVRYELQKMRDSIFRYQDLKIVIQSF